jgi:hypothetical protein
MPPLWLNTERLTRGKRYSLGSHWPQTLDVRLVEVRMRGVTAACRVATVAAAIVVLGGCAAPSAAQVADERVCRLGLVDPIPPQMQAAADLARPYLDEVDDVDIERLGKEIVAAIDDLPGADPRLGDIPFLALLDAMTDLNDACARAGL